MAQDPKQISVDLEVVPEQAHIGTRIRLIATTSDDILDKYPNHAVFFDTRGQGQLSLESVYAEVTDDPDAASDPNQSSGVAHQLWTRSTVANLSGNDVVDGVRIKDATPAGLVAGRWEAIWDTSELAPGSYAVRALVAEFRDLGDNRWELGEATFSEQAYVTLRQQGLSPGDEIKVSLNRTDRSRVDSSALYLTIRNSTGRVSSPEWLRFMGRLVKGDVPQTRWNQGMAEAFDDVAFQGLDAYNVLKKAAELYLMHEAGVIDVKGTLDYMTRTRNSPSVWDQNSSEEERRLGYPVDQGAIESMRARYYAHIGDVDTLPYLALIRDRLQDLPVKEPGELAAGEYGIIRNRFTGPLAIELIWSYWHEEGMQVQTMKAISRRFQNQRGPGQRDPLGNLEIDPLRPLNNVLWGYIQDEDDRLTVLRRAYEYDHHYGLRLQGKAVPNFRPADSRSKFLEAFHTLLYLAGVFYKEDDDTTVIADGFPIMNALTDVHMILAEGAHNQFGDLPWTARVEMLIEQWILSRPEIREFLGGRVMVPYAEPWMDRVDTMKKLQGWSDVSVTHFRDLAIAGERLLLSVRYGNWSASMDTHEAAEWARYWRPEVQKYVHAYRSATGVDLTADPTDTRDSRERFLPPSVHLSKRLMAQRSSR
jgi:hypothetical protein